MIEETKPDIIVGTESWLRPDIKDSEIFPPNFTVYRRDRDTRGSGVFTAVSDHLLSSRQEQLKTSCEMMWTKINVVGSRDLYVCSYCRPDTGDDVSLDYLTQSLDKICNNKNCQMWLAGDFNFPGIDWANNNTIRLNCHYPDQHNQLSTYLLTAGSHKWSPSQLVTTTRLTSSSPTTPASIILSRLYQV